MRKHLKYRLSPSMAVSLSALFVSLGGVGYAATGGNFILGNQNDATTTTRLSAPVTTDALRVTNTNTTAGSTPLSLVAAPFHPALKVNTQAKVANLNVDRLDDLDSTRFLRNGVLQTGAASGGVLNVTNTGAGNGVQGKTASPSASGVYGENTGGAGFGVSGRATGGGTAVYGDVTGSGYAGYFDDRVQVGGNLELVGALDCSSCVSGADVTGKVDDSERLDGFDSTAFGKADGQALAELPGEHFMMGPPMLGFLRLSYDCPSTLTNNGWLKIYNDSGSAANVFVESGGPNPDYYPLAPLGQIVLPAAAGGDSFHIQAQGALGVLTIEAATVHRASDCHAQAQGVLAN